jgi:hypothetical protein
MTTRTALARGAATVRQLLRETLVLAIPGGAIGLLSRARVIARQRGAG